MERVKWYESAPGQTSSTRIMRFEVVQVVLLCMVIIVCTGCYEYIKSGAVFPEFSSMIKALGLFVFGALAGLAGWCGISNKTEQFDHETEEKTEIKK